MNELLKIIDENKKHVEALEAEFDYVNKQKVKNAQIETTFGSLK